jgi:hypothetical protein
MHLSAILGLAALVWAVALILSGTDVTPSFFKPFSTVVGVVVGALALFDLWLWRISFLQGWFVKRPMLQGTWRVEFKSNWVDPTTGTGWPTSYGFMTIRQSYTTLDLRFLSEESTSEVLAQEIIVSPHGPGRLYAVYRNEPKISVRDRSSMHLGTLTLEIHGTAPTSLSGYYWTDRGSRGELRLFDRRGKLFDDYAAAGAAFAKSQHGPQLLT